MVTRKTFALLICLITHSSLFYANQTEHREAKPNKPLSTFEAFQRSLDDFLGKEALGYFGVSEELELYIRGIIKEMGMEDYNIEIRSMSNEAKRKFGRMNAFVMPAFKSRTRLNYLFISEDWFKSLPDQEQKALIGHELTHIKANHLPKKILFALATYAAGSFVAGQIEKLNKAFPPATKQVVSPETWSEIEVLSNPSFVNRFRWNNEETVRIFLGYSMLATWFIPINAWFSRKCEKESDIEGAKALGCARGAAELWQRFINEIEDPESRFWIKRVINNGLHKATYPIRQLFHYMLSTHPKCSDRKAYMEELARLQEQQNV